MGIPEDEIKMKPFSDDLDENNNDAPVENDFGRKIFEYIEHACKLCGYLVIYR